MHVILLLGAAVHPDGPSRSLLNRADHAARLYRAGGVDLILASGGGPGPIPEAEAAAERLRSHGVPRAAILIEPRSRTTWENMAEAAPLIASVGAGRVTIVTDSYHMPRARLAARRHGLTATGSPAPPGPAPGWTRARNALREVPALVWYCLRAGPASSR